MPHKKREIRGGASDFSVSFAGQEAANNLRNRQNTLQSPNISYRANTSDDLYSLVIWDPDAPNPSFLHWMVVNIPEDQILSGTTIQPYHPPTPPSGTHRYYVGLFKQKNPIQPSFPSRTGFSIDSFVNQYDLEENGRKMIKVSASA
jgi:phosphatidylethanolamine-binding protein (PEBP) family uncharacterized protein